MQPVVVLGDEHAFHPNEIGGEDVADDVPDSEQNRAEPTEEQKRELFKLHRDFEAF